MVKEVLKETEEKMQKSIDAAKREFNEVRTGRAHPGLIEGLHADYFGTPTMIRDLATINIPDPRTIMVQPWDKNAIEPIERAIQDSSLGITPQNDGKGIRLTIPQLSEERREELKKLVKEMAEKAKVSLRTIRRDANDKLKKAKGDKEISEDEERKAHDDVQKLTDKFTKEIDTLLDEKSKALMEL